MRRARKHLAPRVGAGKTRATPARSRARVSRVCALAFGVALAVGAAWRFAPLPPLRITAYPAALEVKDREGHPLRIVLGDGDTRCDPIALPDADLWVAKALVAAEDKRFFQHPGIDLLAIVRAVGQNLAAGRTVSGASTLSTQVIRMTTPRPRTIGTKVAEAFAALRLERTCTKSEVLEQYLNRAPFGGNLVGVQAASRRYFGKDAADLTLGEAALLAGLPQSPSRFRPDRHLDRARRRRAYVLARMEELGFIDAAQKHAAERQRLSISSERAPFSAPHFCDWVLREPIPLPAGDARSHTLRTTLDSSIQRVAEQALAQHADARRELGATGAAVVVIDVHSGGVRALVGSPDYADQAHAGQVNAACALRSPGSALKPFAYAMAFDQGACTPDTMLADVPMSFPDYTPRNFDSTFAGPVSARAALVRSLNIPALAVAGNLGLARLHARLRELGLTSLNRPSSSYGLTLVLGTVEVRLLELANAYACLARLGVYRGYRVLEDAPTGPEARLFSEEAAYLVADVLSGNERPLAEAGSAADVRVPRMAWKSGTSTGGRDAWTFVYNPDYVVGVWLGNPDGSPCADMTGAGAAAPIAVTMFRQLYAGGEAPWFDQPEGVMTRTVCATTGAPPNARCPHVAAGLWIPGVSDAVLCQVHQAGPAGPHGAPTTRTVWPPELAAHFAQRGELPLEESGPERGAQRLRVTSPRAAAVYRRSPELPAAVQVLSLAASAPNAGMLHWYVDDVNLGRAPSAGALDWPLQAGRHTIACADANGQVDRVTITVE